MKRLDLPLALFWLLTLAVLAFGGVHNTAPVKSPSTQPTARIVRVTTIQRVEYSDGTVHENAMNAIVVQR